MNVEPLYLTSKDILLLKNKEIGRGTDGVVYKANKDYLYKIYYKTYEKNQILYPSNYQTILDNDGVNIADNREVFRKKVTYNKYQINYYNEEGVKLGGIESIYKAIERQQEIHRTKLQKQPIFVDYHFQGTVLHYHKYVLPIVYLKLLPKHLQIRMLKELLLSVQELLDHNIYHIDLGIKPECIKNTNVFLSLFPKVKPEIIDIDGKSAVYTEQKNSKYYEKSLKSYKNLMTYLLFDIDAEVLEDLDYEYERENLIKKNVPREYVDSILNYEEVIDIPELNTFLDFFDKPKVKSISKRK